MSPASARAAFVVLGASGAVGRAVVGALLDGGHPVLAVARDRARLDELAKASGAGAELVMLPGSLADEAGGAALARELRGLRRPLAGVVDCLAGPLGRGRLLDRRAEDLLATLQLELLPHFIALRQLLPLLAEARRGLPYLVIGGPFAENAWAGYGHLSVAGAALRMLVRAAAQEVEDLSVRVQQLVVDTPLRSARTDVCQCSDWPPVEHLAERARSVLEGAAGNEAVIRFVPRSPGHVESVASGTTSHGTDPNLNPLENES